MSKSMTVGEQRRADILTREIGCLCCRMDVRGYVPADLHHLVEGYRLGHSQTVPLCPWHHRAVPSDGYRPKQMDELYGPSLARDKGAFIARYGTESDLLWMADQMVARFENKVIG